MFVCALCSFFFVAFYSFRFCRFWVELTIPCAFDSLTHHINYIFSIRRAPTKLNQFFFLLSIPIENLYLLKKLTNHKITHNLNYALACNRHFQIIRQVFSPFAIARRYIQSNDIRHPPDEWIISTLPYVDKCASSNALQLLHQHSHKLH